MKPLSLLFALAILLVVCAAASALAAPRAGDLAAPRAGDLAATAAYLHAREAELRSETAAFPAEIKSVEALGRKLSAECPGVLVGAPTLSKGTPLTKADAEINAETVAVIFGAAERVDQQLFQRFAGSVAEIHWSNAGLTSLVHEFAREQVAESGLQEPNLCSDLEVWVASGYQAVSPATEQFVAKLGAASEITKVSPKAHEEGSPEAEAVIMRRLKPYEAGASDKALLHEIEHLGAQQQPLEQSLVKAAGDAADTLKVAVGAPG